MACNLVYAHFVGGLTHESGCDLDRGRCVDDCRWAEFHGWLGAPILVSEMHDLERQQRRREALLRGEVPA